MTFKDKNLSFKDITYVIRAYALRGYIDVMQALDISYANVLSQFAISAEMLNYEAALLPIGAMCGLLEASSLVAKCPDLGLRIAKYQDHEVLGILRLIMMNASTPAEASSIVARFIFFQGTALRIDMQDPGLLIPNTVSINFLSMEFRCVGLAHTA
ncbi:AraC family transcriptional regulator ligand-binding domain-containing protein [Loktanella agnita]|uniref:AraC family transcriptional regulator ligand-binding domain-containing protein n=1 Tax=Loktanella agnita TaxID=287097 RepID=UPI0039881BE4